VRIVSFHEEAFEDYNNWAMENQKIFSKIVKLLKATVKEPFTGIGKPEPLKNNYKGFWSRHITDEHRLVYEVKEDQVLVIACKFHYGKNKNK